jgi:hypothetical protein
MNDFEIMSDGTLLVHMMKCNQLLCPFPNDMEISGTGDGFERVTRDAAAAHVREYGHEVEFVKGTVEMIVPLRTKEKS